MASLLDDLSPAITNLIRLDHAHVLSAFHQYELSGSQRLRRGLADNICLALKIHGQLEEEIFYPALRAASGIDGVSDAVTEHLQLRTLIARLRAMPVTDPNFRRNVHRDDAQRNAPHCGRGDPAVAGGRTPPGRPVA